MYEDLAKQFSNDLIRQRNLATLFPAVAPTRQDRLPLNFPTASVRACTFVFN